MLLLSLSGFFETSVYILSNYTYYYTFKVGNACYAISHSDKVNFFQMLSMQILSNGLLEILFLKACLLTPNSLKNIFK